MSGKKYLILLLSILLFASNVNAQDKFKPEWNVGVGFGSTFSSVDFATTDRRSVKVKSWNQYHGGVSIRYISEKNLGLIGEINYVQQGWKQEFEPEEPYEHSRQLSYIEIPLMTHIYFGDKVRFFFNLGPKMSFLIGQSETMNDALATHLASGNVGNSVVTHQYFRKAERKFDYALTGGAGLEFHTGIGSFALEGRYSFGFGDVYSSTKSDFFSRSANRVISAKLTYYTKLF